MSKLFSSISVRKPKRTVFDLSYSNKLSLDFGALAPMLLEKVVPSDKFYIRDEFMARFAPFYGQVFQAINLRSEYFFVPSRLLWDNFEMFLTSGLDGKTEYVHPYIDYKAVLEWCEQNHFSLSGTLFDFFNLPTHQIDYSGIGDNLFFDALPFYAYCKAYIDYFADENLEYMPLIALFETGLKYAVDGDNTTRIMYLLLALHDAGSISNWALWKQSYDGIGHSGMPTRFNVFKPLSRPYPKDYFTSALPFAQRGPIVQIPLDGEGDISVRMAPLNSGRTQYDGVGVVYNPPLPSEPQDEVEVTLFSLGKLSASSPSAGSSIAEGQSLTASPVIPRTGNGADAARANVISQSEDNTIKFKAVNINGTATITDLRTAVTVQSWLEKRARIGSRPKEQIFGSFAVKSKDYRLDRTEFIGRFASTVKIGEVFTTASNDDDTFVPGLGVSVGQLADGSRRFKKFIPEHGYIIGSVSLYPRAAYFQGVPRQFLELDSLDYFWPEFQGIGEQDIKNIELCVDDVSNTNMDSFGYTPRYAHYKTRTDQIHGDFRTSLEYMVAARKFSTQPHLNNEFIQVSPSRNDLYRIFNATGEWENASPCYIDIYHHVKAIRPMQYFGNPRLI